MKFRDFEVENEVFLAPMAGVTDLPFRLICKELGCGLLYTEMINAKALCYDDKNTKKMLNILDEEHPVAVQIFGSDPEFMGKAAQILNDYPNEILDINMGCPAPKVVKNGDGSALMRNPKLAGQVLDQVVKNSKKPVTLKIRKGWDDNSINALEIAKIAEDCGICAITIHGRTREQYYSGQSDWDIIGEVKSQISIPVIGNGDIFTGEDALEKISYSNVDGVMLARGIFGNPWLIRDIREILEYGEIKTSTTKEDKINMAIEHLKRTRVDNDNQFIFDVRKHISWYLKGMENCTEAKRKINTISDYDEIIKILEEML